MKWRDSNGAQFSAPHWSKAAPYQGKDVETVLMIFPQPLNLTLDNSAIIVHFPAGPQRVPGDLKDHWYLKANKVKLYTPEPVAPEPEKTPNPAGEEDEDAQVDGDVGGEAEDNQQPAPKNGRKSNKKG